MGARTSFRAALAKSKPLVTPAVFDALSASLVEQAGFSAIAISGSAVVGARYGLPDLGMVGLTDMEAGARDILSATSLPCSIDGDDGYGDAKSVVRMIRHYTALGIGSLVLEDQSSAEKRPGETAQAVVPLDQMLGKLEAALTARGDSDLMIVARTDAFLVDGIDEALRRGERFLEAGADGVFLAGIKEVADLERVGRTLKGAYLQAVVSDLSGKDGPSIADYGAMGYGRITIPSMLLLSAVGAISAALEQIKAFSQGGKRPVLADVAGAQKALRAAVRQADWEAITGAPRSL